MFHYSFIVCQSGIYIICIVFYKNYTPFHPVLKGLTTLVPKWRDWLLPQPPHLGHQALWAGDLGTWISVAALVSPRPREGGRWGGGDGVGHGVKVSGHGFEGGGSGAPREGSLLICFLPAFAGFIPGEHFPGLLWGLLSMMETMSFIFPITRGFVWYLSGIIDLFLLHVGK